MGANASIGGLSYPISTDPAHINDQGGVMLGVGLDMTFPITDLISVGGYVELNVSRGVGFGFTPSVAFSFPDNSAIIVGIGYRGTDHFHSNGFLMRAAYKLSNPWYVTASYSVGHGNTFMLGAGYTIFGRKID
jgi:hypothetical protein